MLATITEDYIKRVLRDHQKLITAIHDRLLELYSEMDDSDGMIRAATFGSSRLNIGGGHSSEKSDLTDIMLRHFKLLKAQSQEIRTEMWRLIEEQETINRIWICYKAIDGEARQLLTDLYVKERPYKDVQFEALKNKGISRTSFERMRKEGIAEIERLYYSDITNVDIINQTVGRKKQKKKIKQKVTQESYEQIALDLFKN